MSSRHYGIGNCTDATFLVDRIGTDEKLVAFLVDHPVGRCPPDAFRADYLFQVRSYFIELVGRTEGKMRSVGDYPQPVGPGDNSSCAALSLIVVICQMGVDTANISHITRTRCFGSLA